MTPDAVDDGPILLFDGVCNLCNGLVQFVIPRDPEGRLRFASLQSDVGRTLVERCGLSPDALDTLVLLEGDACYTKSTAALRLARHLGGIYGLLYALRYVPRSVRDVAYDVVADNRYRWFGRREQCMVPTGDIESRFLD